MSLKVIKDFEIPVVERTTNDEMPMDEAVDSIFEQQHWPLLGGPSGRGWSYYSVAQRCPRLFQAGVRQRSIPLEVGGLYHTLQALYYAAMRPTWEYLNRGLWACNPVDDKYSYPIASVEILLNGLKDMAGIGEDSLIKALQSSADGQNELPITSQRVPSRAVILEAERLFTAHAAHWGDLESLTPLAIEFFAKDETLNYTCRYDMIARIEANDAIAPPGVYIIERKTAKWIDEAGLEGWAMDGEILGQLWLWKTSGCEALFGPLAGLIMDIVSKAKTPECRRLILPPNLPQVEDHARWVRYTQSQIAAWKAYDCYPQSFGNCYGRYGRCENWNACITGGGQ